jgi:hypothetical protein
MGKLMFRGIKSKIYYNLINSPGWRTKKKIVVIESDDWGSIRMPSKDVYQKFVNHGLNLSNSDYNRIDTIESNDDLLQLYDVLSSYRDCNGNHPVITANMVIGNPDFKRIKDSDYQQYYYEVVTETLKQYTGRDRVESLWKEGYEIGIFNPQLHGREHVNVERWMNALRTKTPEILFTFSNNTTFSGEGDYNFMEVLDFTSRDEITGMKKSLIEGLSLFEDIFGYRSKSFIAPCYAWDSELESVLYSNGIRYLQGLIVQLVPKGSFGDYKRRYHFLGGRSSSGLTYLIRNCFFEPTLSARNNVVENCLRNVDIAFAWRKPAIIYSHRINYIGDLHPDTTKVNLRLLDELLRRILKQWPDVEFMTSDQLGDMITNGEIVEN